MNDVHCQVLDDRGKNLYGAEYHGKEHLANLPNFEHEVDSVSMGKRFAE